MKKIVYICSLLILLVIFCLLLNNLINGSNNGTLVCKYSEYQDNNEYISEYKVNYSDRLVNVVNSNETIISSDKEYLDKTKNELETQYSIYKDLKYYDNNIELKKDRIISNTTINYKKINIDELLKIDDSIKIYLDKNNRINIKYFKKEYEKNGSKCIFK